MNRQALIDVKNLSVRFRRTPRSRNTLKEILSRTAISHSRPKEASLGNSRDQKYIWALRNVTFRLLEGDVLGVVGNNGAGKTTLLKVLSGIYAPREGEVLIRCRLGCLLSISAGLNPQLTGLDNIFLFGTLQGLRRDEIKQNLEDIIEFSELGSFIYDNVKGYSAGMRARLGFSIASVLTRDILLLDEVLAVGDVHFRKKCQRRLERMVRAVRAGIIVSHDLEFIRSYCSRTLWLEKGKIRQCGSTKAVLEEYLAADSVGLGAQS